MVIDPWSVESVTATLNRDVPVIAGGLLGNALAPDDERRRWAERAMSHVRVLCDGDEARLASATEAFAVTSLDFLRLQARFLKTGRYACGPASDLSGLYSDSEQMTEYLDGLALSYAMWANHASTVAYFVNSFVEALPPAPTVIEVGPGHGLFASLLFEHRPSAQYIAADISERSLAYTGLALKAASIPETQFELRNLDVTSDELGGDGSFDAVVCCEVLEHVDDPTVILEAVRGLLRPEGKAFLTTVANMEAVDHVFLFDDVDHIRRFIHDSGLSILDDRPTVLAGSEGQERLPVNYSAIARL